MGSETIPPTPRYLQQEETLSEEVKHFISSLPKEKGWLASHLYQYQGFWYPVRHLAGVLSCQKHFLPKPHDIFLVSTPKSGTTWLKAISFSLLHRSLFPPSSPSHPLTSSNPHSLVPFLEIHHYTDGRIPDLSSSRLFSTHLPLSSLPKSITTTTNNNKIVYLCRNPKDIFVSLHHFTNGLKPIDSPVNSIRDAFDMFCSGVSLFGPCWDHILGYWELSREDCDRVLFLKFEEMKERPREEVRRLAEFLGCPFTAEEEEKGVVEDVLKLCSFEGLSGLEVNRSGKLASGEENRVFFRRGVVGDWRNYLDQEMAARFDRIAEEKFQGSGLVL